MAEKEKILLIDNDTNFLETTKIYLEQNGFNVIVAQSLKQAIDKAQFEQPDLIIVELMLEKHDTGFSISKHVKANPLLKNTKILMVSSAKEKTGAEFTQQLDGYWMKTDDYMNKPVSSEELLSRIKALLKKEK